MLRNLFEITNQLSQELQKDSLDVVTAYHLSKNTIDHLYLMRENDFESIYSNAFAICEKNEFVFDKNMHKRTYKPIDPVEKKQNYLRKFKLVIDYFITEINERFNKHNYEPLIELYNSFMNLDYKTKIDLSKIRVYQKYLDFDRLIYDLEAFTVYKINNQSISWKNFNILVKYFSKNNLKSFFPEVHKAMKLYLSVPVGSTTAERSFSCLKILKNYLRSTMITDRLSDLAIIKMYEKFTIDYE